MIIFDIHLKKKRIDNKKNWTIVSLVSIILLVLDMNLFDGHCRFQQGAKTNSFFLYPIVLGYKNNLHIIETFCSMKI